MKDKVFIAIKIVLAAVLLISAGYLFAVVKDEIVAFKEYSGLRADKVLISEGQPRETDVAKQRAADQTAKEQNTPQDGMSLPAVDEATLKIKNPEYRAWLYVPEIKVDLPVVYPENNAKYLDKTFSLSDNPSGCLFFDAGNNPVKVDNATIHGHNMKSGAMFGRLKELLDGKKKVVKAYLLIDGKWHVYRLFSIYVTDNTDFEPYTSTFFDEHEYGTFKEARSLKSEIEFSKPPEGRKMLTLSTCHGKEQMLQAHFYEE